MKCKDCNETSTQCTCEVSPEAIATMVVENISYDYSNAPAFFVDDEGIYASAMGTSAYQQVMSKEMFVEAYNRWIKGIQPTEDIYRLNPCFVCGDTIVVKPHGDALVVQCTGCGIHLEYKGTMNSLAAFWNNIVKEK